jgi:hypothetical protein
MLQRGDGMGLGAYSGRLAKPGVLCVGQTRMSRRSPRFHGSERLLLILSMLQRLPIIPPTSRRQLGAFQHRIVSSRQSPGCTKAVCVPRGDGREVGLAVNARSRIIDISARMGTIRTTRGGVCATRSLPGGTVRAIVGGVALAGCSRGFRNASLRKALRPHSRYNSLAWVFSV